MARPAILFVAAALSALAAGPAIAQSAGALQTPLPGTGPVTDPNEIRYCLCAHESVTTLGAQVDAETKQHQETQDQIAALDKQLAESRTNVDVNQPDQVEAYRRLVETREKTMAAFTYDLTPRLQQLVARYNAQTESYNASCTTRSLDASTLEAVKANLVCPAEQ
ncbi:MAG TPA: hypothetical protein VKQ29_05635 [Aliidongia sp.]|nr:hypothetical protein [Aliidongia sp.]